MEYFFAGSLLLIIFIVRSRVAVKREARDFVFDVALPCIIVKQFPNEEVGFIGAYIFAHQHEIYDDIAADLRFGMYGARIALARLNLVQAISNSKEILELLEGTTGEELLGRVKELILKVEKQASTKI